jgi:bacterioferritin-associated ferredoxin
MIVCSCHGITDRQIRQAVRNGASSTLQVARRCSAGTGCGGCLPALEKIVRDEREREARRRPDALAVAAGGS